MGNRIINKLHSVRLRRGIGAADLARRVGVSRQTIYAIEAGNYVPNTEVTLKLSRELGVSVEALFSLDHDDETRPSVLPTDFLSRNPPVEGQAVRICAVGERRVSIPVTASPYYLPEADGLIAAADIPGADAGVVAFAPLESGLKKLVLAGCDPAMGFISRVVEKSSGVQITTAGASSKLAIQWLAEGKVHVAGCHLLDAESGEYNLPYIREHFPDDSLAVIHFARWEQGFVTAEGNPLNIRAAEDLVQKGLRLINREAGSGSRALLDRLLADAGIPSAKVRGYDRVAYGHLAVAHAVLTKEADCCVATRAAARAFQLSFVPLEVERYDLVMQRQTAKTMEVQAFIDILQRTEVQRKLEALAGYDPSLTGSVLA